MFFIYIKVLLLFSLGADFNPLAGGHPQHPETEEALS